MNVFHAPNCRQYFFIERLSQIEREFQALMKAKIQFFIEIKNQKKGAHHLKGIFALDFIITFFSKFKQKIIGFSYENQR